MTNTIQCKVVKVTQGATSKWAVVRCEDAQGFICTKMVQISDTFKHAVGDTISIPAMYLRDLPVSAPVAAPLAVAV